ncbi:MAG TPA: protein kinase family protein [Chitinophagaceae bacterium]|nr:protein kinase family protein [Chitinophagaceae bacterium]
MQFDRRIKKVLLTENDGEVVPEQNSIDIEGKTYYLKYINSSYSISKGGNSSVYTIYDPQEEEADRAIKICSFSKPNRYSPDWVQRRYGRFMNEIDALNKVKDHNAGRNVVSIEGDGLLDLDGKLFPYYVMEKADTDLKEYLLKNSINIDFQERVKLCVDIYNGIKTLHDLDFYHRDIKPDNILLFYLNDEDEDRGRKFIWKVGDLGLVAHRDKDYDDIGEKIGPIGWLSPEAMNKFLTEASNLGLDCVIDEESDVFQLGKLFWFIFEYNVPIGQVQPDDFVSLVPHKDFIFKLIKGMLEYPKSRRSKKATIQESLELLAMEFGV